MGDRLSTVAAMAGARGASKRWTRICASSCASRRDEPSNRPPPSSTAGPCDRRRRAALARLMTEPNAKGSKLHPAVDTLGHLLALHVPPANADDRAEVGRIAKAIQAETGESLAIAFVDQGYTGEKPEAAAAEHGIALEVTSCQRPSAALSCCPDDGWSSAPLHGPHGSGGPSRTTSDAPRPSQTSTSPPSRASCSKTSLKLAPSS